MTRGIICLGLALIGLAGVACAHRGAAKPSLTPVQVQELVKKQQTEDPYLRTQVDVTLSAHLTQPGMIQVNVTNNTTHPLLIGPKCFRVFNPASHQWAPVLPTSIKTFPLIKVAPKEEAGGELAFSQDLVVKGGRLGFFHTEAQPAMTRIE